MDVQATLNYLRMSPRKVRLVTNLLQGKTVAQAEAQLAVMEKAASAPLRKLLRSAVANATHNYRLIENELYIKACLTNEGPKLKRFTPRAFGRAAPILKRSSRVTFILSQQKSATTKRHADQRTAPDKQAIPRRPSTVDDRKSNRRSGPAPAGSR